MITHLCAHTHWRLLYMFLFHPEVHQPCLWRWKTFAGVSLWTWRSPSVILEGGDTILFSPLEMELPGMILLILDLFCLLKYTLICTSSCLTSLVSKPVITALDRMSDLDNLQLWDYNSPNITALRWRKDFYCKVKHRVLV